MFTKSPGFFQNLVRRKLPEHFIGRLGLLEPMIKHIEDEVRKSIRENNSLSHPRYSTLQ